MTALLPIALEGAEVRLEPISLEHVPALLRASNEAPSLYAWNLVPQTEAAMDAYVRTALAGVDQGHSMPFAIIRRRDGVVVGTTRFLSIERWAWPPAHPHHGRSTPDVCEIGATWLAKSAMRTPVNTQAKRLLLTHAFDTWRAHRVTLRTDVRNARSRAAIERIGGKLDGIVRAERPGTDGTVRDSAMYSIVAAEWAAVRERLEQLERR